MEGETGALWLRLFLEGKGFVFAAIACDTRQGNEASMGIVACALILTRGLFHD
jgi:hypothetical protein